MNLPKGVIYVIVAGLAGLVAVFTVHRYVSVKTHVPVASTGQVVVASGDIFPGAALNGNTVAIASWPANLIPPKTASSLKQVDGRVAVTPIAKGEPIFFTKLAPEGTAAGLGALLNEDKRALSVRVDDVSGVAGFVHPGDHVDVLVELPVPGASGEHFSKTILQNVVILSAGQFWEQNNERKPVLVNTVTLELTPEEGEILTLASNQGKIRLALRSRQNKTVVQTSGVATSHLLALTPKKEKEAVAPVPKDNGRKVEVIKGLERTKATL
jgi:pilus assembly protein CpaB